MFVERNWIRVPPDKLQYRMLHGDSGELARADEVIE